MIRTRLYRSGNLESSDFDPAEISDHLAEPDSVVWMDLCQPAADDFALLPEEFGLDPLAVEDATSERQRPKLDHYESHLFLTMYSVELDADSGELRTSELAAFASSRYLITVRKDPHFAIEPVLAAWDGSPDLAKYGVGFLLYGLLDVVVDGHFTAVETLEDGIESLEDLLFAPRTADTEVQRRSFELRKSLVQLRRLVLPMRELVNTLLRRELHVVDPGIAPYYQDVYDHVLRVTEQTESLRDLVATILETNLTLQSNRLNEVMKKVTSWAAIIAVPTAVTGFYGMNVPYPGFARHSGFVTSLLLLIGLSVGLYATFRRRGWL